MGQSTRTGYTLIYRTGGTENFAWHRTGLLGTALDMQIERAKLLRAGHRAYVKKSAELASIGLPDTFGTEVGLAEINEAIRFLASHRITEAGN